MCLFVSTRSSYYFISCVSRKLCVRPTDRADSFWGNRWISSQFVSQIIWVFFGSNNISVCLLPLNSLPKWHFEVKSKVVHTVIQLHLTRIGIDSQESCDRYTWIARKLVFSSHLFNMINASVVQLSHVSFNSNRIAVSHSIVMVGSVAIANIRYIKKTIKRRE